MKINKTLKEHLILMRKTNVLVISILLGIFTTYPVALKFNIVLIYAFIAIISCIYYSILNIVSDRTLPKTELHKVAIVVGILVLLALYVIIYELAFPMPNVVEKIIQIILRLSYFAFMFGSLFYYSFKP